ncbi:MAG: O-antigen ligase family protein [Chloroflexi bacterium]|nr:O-antigen ligase family protein [Chloroflexota bacterium]
MPSKLSAWCNGIIEAGWIAALVIAPLYFNGYTSTVIEPDKLALLRALASGMLAAWFVRWLDQRHAPRVSIANALRAPFVLPVGLILIVTLLATLTSLAPRISFFGAYHRPHGFTALIAYLIIFALMRSDLRTRAQLDRVIVAITLTSLPIALYAIFQKLNLDPMPWRAEFAGRVAATMGNPIFLGAYLAMIFPLTASQVFRYARAPRNARAACAYAIILVAQTVAIFFTASRGPWLGWFAGIALFGLLLALLLNQRRFVFGAIGLSALALVFLIALNLPGTPLAPLRAIPELDRLSHLADSTGEFRLFTWENSARLVAPHAPLLFPDGARDPFNVVRPFLGYGLDTMALVYFQVSPPSPYGAERVTDHSHNETWDTLVTTGLAGLIAYQIFYLGIFFYGLRWLGFLETPRAQKIFIALWIGLGAAGAVGAMLAGQIKYVGLMMPLGNLGAILAGLFATAPRPALPRVDADRVLIAALLAGFCAHYVESQFGIAVPATRLLEWTFAGMLIVVGARQIEARAAQPAQSPNYALLLSIILATLLFGFFRSDPAARDPVTLFWRALVFDPAQNTHTYTILVLILLSWLIGIGISLSATGHTDLLWLIGAPLATLLAVGFGLAMQLHALPNLPIPVARLEDVATLVAQVTQIVDFYAWSVFIWIGLAAWMLQARPLPNAWSANRWSLIALAPLALVAFVWINAANLNPIRADVAYRLGKMFDEQAEWQAAAVGYQLALASAPLNDAYYMAFGRALQNQARAADPTARAQFNGDTRLEQILARDPMRAPKLNRVDLLFAAQKMLLRARDLNPLYSDHTLNLARFYAPDLPVNTEGKLKLAELSNEYYAQTTRLMPNDARLWNEWAEFELTYRENVDSALSKLQESARRDPGFAPTFVQMGDLYKAKANFDQAISAYQRALAAKSPPPEAASKLAFVYYQQDKFAEAIQNYLKYIELAPQDEKLWEAHKNLALIYKQSGDLRAAIREAELACALATGDAKMQLNDLVNQWRGQ